MHRDVLHAEEEKARVQLQIADLTEKLGGLNASLAGKLQARAEYDRTIRETEIAYAKIVESSETLLRVLRREATHLAQGQGQGHEKQQQQQQQQQMQQQMQQQQQQQMQQQQKGGGLYGLDAPITGAGVRRRLE